MGKVFYIHEHSDEDYKQYQMCETMEVIKILQPISFITDEWDSANMLWLHWTSVFPTGLYKVNYYLNKEYLKWSVCVWACSEHEKIC